MWTRGEIMMDIAKNGKGVLEVCPLCHSEMEKGFIAFASGLAWSNKKFGSWSFKGLFSGEIVAGKGIGPNIYCIPAYRCKKCKLIIFRYGEVGSSSEVSL